jgi:hypothetical protein
MRGDIMITFEDHHMPPLMEHYFYKANYISRGQHILISVCFPAQSDHCTINITSIIMGECLENIKTQDGSQIREVALAKLIVSLAYDEKSLQVFMAITRD